jgi:DNA-binding MarR family transcriptional regulator
MPTPEDWDSLEVVKRASVGQLLLKGARLLDERALSLINRQGPKIPLRPAHTSLFPHIDKEGTRLTELARRLGVTKQAAGQLVSDLETLEVVERLDDPADGRAKLVRFTRKGMEALHHGLSVLRGIEAELEQRLGEARMRALHAALAEVVDELARDELARDEPEPSARK